MKPERTPRNFSELLIAINSFLQHPTLWPYYWVLLARKMNAVTVPNFMKTSYHTENDTVLLLLRMMQHFTHYERTPSITALQPHLSRVKIFGKNPFCIPVWQLPIINPAMFHRSYSFGETVQIILWSIITCQRKGCELQTKTERNVQLVRRFGYES